MSSTPTGMITVSPITRGYGRPVGGLLSVGAFRHPTDPIGIFTLSLKNLVVGSRVRIEAITSGQLIDEFVSTAVNEDRAISLYASGSPLNDLRIKVRKASESPTYRPFESQTAAQRGVVTVYVFQELDE